MRFSPTWLLALLLSAGCNLFSPVSDAADADVEEVSDGSADVTRDASGADLSPDSETPIDVGADVPPDEDVADVRDITDVRDVADASVDMTDAADVSDAAPDVPPPDPTPFSNEPAGHVVIAEHDFSFVPSDPTAGSPLEGFWNLQPGFPLPALQEASHADALTSSPETVEVKLPAGLEPYGQDWWIEVWEPNYGAYPQAYVSMTFKLLGDDFENDQSGVLLAFLSVAIQADEELRMQIQLAPENEPRASAFSAVTALHQHPGNTSLRTFLPNIDSRHLITAGEFHELELLLTNNTIGAADGALQLWIDDVLVAEYSDLQMQTANKPGGIGYFLHYFDWLGSTPRAEDDVIAVDHVRISVSP